MHQIRFCNSTRIFTSGMTLVEILVVMVIIGTLSAIAYPSVTRHITRSHQAAAKADLIKLQLAIESGYDRNNTNYTNGYNFSLISAQTNYCIAELNCQSDKSRFQFSVSELRSNEGYILTAKDTGSGQSEECRTIKLFSDGRQEPVGCW